MKDDFKIRLWVGLGVIVGSMVLAGGAFYYFSGIIQTQASQVVAEKTTQETDADAVANLAALESAAPKAAAYDAAIDKLLPDQQGLIMFNTWVQQIASKYGITSAISYDESEPTPASGPTPGSADFSMTAQGPEGSMEPFLDTLTKTPGFIVSFTTIDVTDQPGQASLTASGVSYFR